MRWDNVQRVQAVVLAGGWTLDSGAHFVTPSGKRTGVVLSFARGRFYAHSEAGAKLWSGPDPVAFVRAFWGEQ